ncbi:MAG: Ig-like domain-containing protein [Candidatus Kapabacteria bacterium]|nr:Ig-like domain-containing protein [Candidatus Kapabacteria bacterium]
MDVFHKRFMYSAIALILCVIASSCAMKVAPSGGPRDTTPAEIASVEPPSGTTSITTKTITLTFDDYVDRSVRNAITVLPNARFSSSYGGDAMGITFEEPLDTNTTYTITLGTEWTDLRGNKPTQAYTMVFSTGDHIDSGSISGTVYGSSLANISIFCYQRADTLPSAFTPRSVVPKFRLPVGSSGAFAVRGLPDGAYRVIAARDENRNGLLENTEDFVVAPQDVQITNGATPALYLLLGKAIDRDPPAIARVRAITNRLVSVQFSENVDPSSNWHNSISVFTAGGDSVPVSAMWLDRTPGDVLFLRLASALDTARYSIRLSPRSVVDLNGVVSADTISRSSLRGTSTVDTTSLRILQILPVDSAKSVRLDEPIVIRFSDAVDTSAVRMTIWHESPKGASPVSVSWLNSTTLSIKPLVSRSVKTWYRTNITFNHVRSVTGSLLIDTILSHNVMTEERQSEPGTIKGVVIDTFGLTPSSSALHLRLRFLSATGTVVTSIPIAIGAPFTIDQIPPGDYKLDVFSDRNGNGLYDYGDHSPFSYGEQWWPSRSTVTVRARWTVEDLRITFGSGAIQK